MLQKLGDHIAACRDRANTCIAASTTETDPGVREIDRRELIDLIDSLNALNLAWWDSLPDSEKSFTVRL